MYFCFLDIVWTSPKTRLVNRSSDTAEIAKTSPEVMLKLGDEGLQHTRRNSVESGERRQSKQAAMGNPGMRGEKKRVRISCFSGDQMTPTGTSKIALQHSTALFSGKESWNLFWLPKFRGKCCTHCS